MTDFARIFSFIDWLAWATFLYCLARGGAGIIWWGRYSGSMQQKIHMVQGIHQSPVLFRYGVGLVLSIGWLFVK